MRKRVGKYFQKMFKNDIPTARDTQKHCFLEQKTYHFGKIMYFLPKISRFLEQNTYFSSENVVFFDQNTTIFENFALVIVSKIFAAIFGKNTFCFFVFSLFSKTLWLLLFFDKIFEDFCDLGPFARAVSQIHKKIKS